MTRRAFLASLAAATLRAQGTSPLKIVVTGGHPGDPECGCAGTIAKWTALGHHVTLLYLNRGEGYCGTPGASASRCAAIRTVEAEKACAILKARAAFADQIDGKAVVDGPRYEAFARILRAEAPDVVLTQWPVDTHRDHRAVSSLTVDAWLQGGRKFALYYYEVAEDTALFEPSEFVDISSVEPQRRAACFAHASQQPDKWYPKQVEITRAHGLKRAVAQAEGFRPHTGSRTGMLP